MRSKISIRKEKISPKTAIVYLKCNFGNRRLRKSTITSYANQMRDGEWCFVGDTIVFDSNGKLRNGQHRLNAVIESGVTIEQIVVRGVDPASFAYMDANSPRKTGDVLGIMGMTAGHKLETGVRIIIGINNVIRGISPLYSIRDSKASRATVIDFANEWRSELESITHFVIEELDAKKTLGVTQAVLIGTLFAIENTLMVERDEDGNIVDEYFAKASKSTSATARDFFSKLVIGDGLTADSPILKLRNRLHTSLSVSKKLAQHQKVVLILLAWNSIVRKEETRWYGHNLINKWPGIIWPEDIANQQ